MTVRALCLLIFVFCFGMAAAPAGADGVVDVASRGQTVRLLVEEPASEPVAVVVLFAGGRGVLKLDADGRIGRLAGNFLIRSRAHFRDHGLITVAIDGPSDRSLDLFKFRGSADHAADVAAVIAHLRTEYGLPVWLAGTSRGTNSVANAAVRLKGAEGPDGIVLTATMLSYNRRGDQVLDMALERVTVPVVIAHHKRDGCSVTPPAKVEALAKALKNAASVEVLWYDGGQPQGPPCQAMHYHGFIGQEAAVAADIAAAIKRSLPGGG